MADLLDDAGSVARALPRPFASRDGAPVLTRVDGRIFEARYFGACMACTFCHDACCDHGVDVEEPKVHRILARAEELEPLVGVPRDRWFEREVSSDAEFPGGASRRTAVVDGRCVFRSRVGRGCVLHAHALSRGEDYHDIKPLVSTLFPLTFCDGALCLSDELDDPEAPFVCAGAGPTVYEALRGELAYWFGAELVELLDRMAAGA
jgi:hypothetical protein